LHSPPRAGLLSSIMLFLPELLLFLLSILLGPSMVSAELGSYPSDVLRIPDMQKHRGTWLRKPGTTNSNYLNMIRSEGDGYVKLETFGRSGGTDNFLTEQNKGYVLGRWRQLPEGTVQLEDRLSELSFWQRGGKIYCQMIHAKVLLPASSPSPSDTSPAKSLPAQYKGTWYRAVAGLDRGGTSNVDVIEIAPNKSPRIGQLEFNAKVAYLFPSPPTMRRLVGGWLLMPSPSGQYQPNDLLLVWIQGGELKYKLTSLASYMQAKIGNLHP